VELHEGILGVVKSLTRARGLFSILFLLLSYIQDSFFNGKLLHDQFIVHLSAWALYNSLQLEWDSNYILFFLTIASFYHTLLGLYLSLYRCLFNLWKETEKKTPVNRLRSLFSPTKSEKFKKTYKSYTT
jgi:succinate dehydrogenase/fumarate reductase cytochrome b subunit